MRRERGFTLIEVMLALTLGALLVMLAHRLFASVADGATRLTQARTTIDREQNARRWLEAAFGSLDVGTGSGGFAGSPNRAEFTSWQLTPDGWFSRRSITLTRREDRLLALVAPGDTIFLTDSVSNVELDYLLDAGGDGTGDSRPGTPGAQARFVREWISPVSAPIAVRLRITHARAVDTLFLIVGPRG